MSGPLISDFRIRNGGHSSERPPRDAVETASDQLRIFELSQLWRALRARWRFVVGMGVFVLGLVLAVTFVSPMTFRASGRLYLGEIGSRPSAGAQSDPALGDDTPA